MWYSVVLQKDVNISLINKITILNIILNKSPLLYDVREYASFFDFGEFFFLSNWWKNYVQLVCINFFLVNLWNICVWLAFNIFDFLIMLRLPFCKFWNFWRQRTSKFFWFSVPFSWKFVKMFSGFLSFLKFVF